MLSACSPECSRTWNAPVAVFRQWQEFFVILILVYISRKVFLLTLVFVIAAVAVFALLGTARKQGHLNHASVGSVGMAVPAVAPREDGAIKMAADVTSSYLPSPLYPQPESVRQGGMYLQDTSLSLVSSDPAATESQIRQITTDLEGFLVSSTSHRPEEGATATITVRVPTDRLDEALQRFEEAGERVLSKSIQGQDVTDQYRDLEARLETLNAVQARLEALLEQTDQATALLQIQQQLFQIQDQKDAIEGQRQYLEDAAAMTRITVFVASDEQALPYVPAEPWKPEAVFKQAVRSLVATLRGVGSAVIWVVVYLPLLLPFVLVAWILNRFLRK